MFTNKPMIIYFVSLNDEVVYIGQTKLSLEKRKRQHEYSADRGKGYIIGSGLRKHGKDSFAWNVHSVYYNQVDLDAAEKHYIAKYRPRYNINCGGEARGTHKQKGRRPWNKGKVGGQVAWNKGRKETRPEVLASIKASAKDRDSSNRRVSESHKQALAEGRRGAYRAANRTFVCHQTGKEYSLVVDAAKDLGIPANGIYAVLNPKHSMKSYKGFTFSYCTELRAA